MPYETGLFLVVNLDPFVSKLLCDVFVPAVDGKVEHLFLAEADLFSFVDKSDRDADVLPFVGLAGDEG